MAAPPNLAQLLTPKTPFPKATPQTGKTAPTTPPGRGYNPTAPDGSATTALDGMPKGGNGIFGSTGDGTHAVHINQAGSDKVAAIRKQLVEAGYDVAAHGPGTERLKKAYSHYVATNGGGSKVWNAHNAQITHPAPQHVVKGPLHVRTAPTAPSVPPVAPEQLPNDQVPGAPQLPANLQALLDKEFAPYSGDQGQPTIVDPKKLAASQADLQYGGVIDQSRKDISDMQGAEPGAQANITKYFAPVQQAVQDAAVRGSDAGAANVAATASLSPGLAAALNLTGANAGTLNATGDAATNFARNMAQLDNEDNQNSIKEAARQEAQAHVTEDANATIGLSGARRQLIQQLAAKGQAQTVDEGTNRQQNFVNRTQGIANAGAITNINATRGLAKTNIIQGILQNANTTQGLDINKRTSDTNQVTTKAQLKQAAVNLRQTLINNKRLTETPIPSSKNPNATSKIPFTGINAGDRDTLAAGLWAKFGNLPPAKAEQQLNQYMTSFYGYNSTPAIRAWIKSTVQQHQWDSKAKKYKA